MTATLPSTERRTTAVLVLFLIAMCGSIVALKAKTDTIARKKVPGASIIYVPSGKFLRFATFGYPALAADIIYLWAIQYYGTPTIDDRFNYLDHIFAIIAELDPYYADPYETGAMIATTEALNPDIAFKILDLGLQKNPDQWIFPFDAGHIALMTLKDYDRAMRYFKACMEIPGSPDFVKRLYANALYKKGDLKTSWETWLDILRSAPDDRTKKIASNHLYQVKATSDVGAINEALGQFRKKYGRFPEGLDRLVQVKLLAAVPTDLDGNEYLYDLKTGEVKAAISPWKR